MTPDDLAAIRADTERLHINGMPDWIGHCRALCDALEAAWDEGVAQCSCGMPHYCQSEINDLTERIMDTVRADLERAKAAAAQLRQETDDARAEAARYADALARVRALADRYEHVPYGIDSSEIRAALEGDQQ